jgi:hypothetical protein
MPAFNKKVKGGKRKREKRREKRRKQNSDSLGESAIIHNP